MQLASTPLPTVTKPSYWHQRFAPIQLLLKIALPQWWRSGESYSFTFCIPKCCELCIWSVCCVACLNATNSQQSAASGVLVYSWNKGLLRANVRILFISISTEFKKLQQIRHKIVECNISSIRLTATTNLSLTNHTKFWENAAFNCFESNLPLLCMLHWLDKCF